MSDIALGEAMLLLARGAIGAQFGRQRPTASHPELDRPGATFVTLMYDGALRGCIGTLEAKRDLRSDVQLNAINAAFGDPRFPPLSLGEFADLEVEVSLLNPCERVGCVDEEDLLRQMRPNVDGLVLAFGRRRGTFLPQVWESLPDPRQFLRELKRKAGLASDFWHPDIEVSRYTVTKWTERDIAMKVKVEHA